MNIERREQNLGLRAATARVLYAVARRLDGVKPSKNGRYYNQTIILASDFQKVNDNERAVGSVLKINPDARIRSSESHLSSYCISSGAIELEALVRDYPPAIFVWIVDPSVGTDRKGLLIETGNGAALIGPDNGLLLPAARFAGIERIWKLDREALKAKPFSIFDGRDLFMKAAGYLSKGVTPSEIAQPMPEDQIVPLSFHPNQVVRIDGSGNVVLEHFYDSDYLPGQTSFLLRTEDESEISIPFVRSFNDVEVGKLGFLEGSIGGRLWLFVNEGSAADALGIKINQFLNILPVGAAR